MAAHERREKLWGFRFHQDIGSGGELNILIRDTMLSEESATADCIRKMDVENLIDWHIGGKEDLSQQLKVLLVSELWWNTFIEISTPAGLTV